MSPRLERGPARGVQVADRGGTVRRFLTLTLLSLTLSLVATAVAVAITRLFREAEPPASA